MTTDDRLVSGATSLNPNKSSGDIVELKPCPFCGGRAFTMWGVLGRCQTTCTECHAGTPSRFESEELSETAWNTRTPDPESAVAAAWEEAAKIAETFFFNDVGKLQVGPSIQDGIASAIRAASGSAKTAESGNPAPSHNSASE